MATADIDKLKFFTLAPHPVNLPNGNTAYLRRLTADQRIAWIEYVGRSKEKNVDLDRAFGMQAILIAMTLCDEAGTRTFAGTEEDAAIVRRELEEPVFHALSNEALIINGLGGRGAEAVKKK